MAETQEVSHAEQPDKVPKVAEVQETREVEEEDTKLEVNDDEQVEEAPEDVAEDASSSPPSPRDTPPSPTSTHSAPPPTTTAHSAQDESTSVARVREAQTPTVAQGASSPSSSPQRPRRRRRQASGQAKQVPKTTAGSLWGALNPFAWGGSSAAATAESGKGAGKAVSSSKEERRARGGGAAGGGPAAGGPAAGGGVDGTSKYTYKYFASKMKHPKAKPLLDLIRRFVQDFAGRELDAGAEGGYAGDVHRFLKKTFLRMVKHELWSRASPEERDATFESLEKFVTGKLYDKLLRATPEERARDVALERKVAQLTFLQPEHLDIPPQYVSAKVLQLAADEILRIATFKSPRDKIICLLNCCKILMDHLNTFRTPVPSPSVTPTPGSPAHTSAGEPADAQAAPAGSLADSDLDGNDSSSSQTQFLTRPPSVDDMLPLMILVLIKAQLPHLLLHTQYMSEVRHPAKLAGEASYYLTSLHSAVAFLETVQSSNLSISAEEFEQRMAERGAELDREEAERRKQEEEKRRQEEEEEQQRAAQYDAASAAVDAAAVMATGRGRMPLKDMFKFLDVSADELRVADVPRLLADYKRIAHALIHLRRSSKPRRT